MSKTPPTNDESGRIHSASGTYERQFRGQALQAADAALALWIVRIPCGVIALLMIICLVLCWLNASVVDLNLLLLTVCVLTFTIDFGNVALRGKSFSLRFALSGVRRGQAELDDGDDVK
jgi:hypothetical protein